MVFFHASMVLKMFGIPLFNRSAHQKSFATESLFSLYKLMYNHMYIIVFVDSIVTVVYHMVFISDLK